MISQKLLLALIGLAMVLLTGCTGTKVIPAEAKYQIDKLNAWDANALDTMTPLKEP